MPRVRWDLAAYENDYFVAEWRLEEIDVDDLRRLFDQPLDEPMSGCFPVGPGHVERLQAWVPDHRIQLDKYDYFVEDTAVGS